MGKLQNLGFRSARQTTSFLTVVFSGQVIYAAFESFKIPFYEPLRQLLGLNNEQFGTMFTMLGIALFFYIPGGWVNNHLSVRTVLLGGLTWRVITGLIMVLLLPPYPVLLLIALSWGILDGFYWPAVVKGVALFAGANNKSFGFGILNGFRACGEAILNGILIIAMALTQGSLFTFRTGMGIYSCLGLILIVLIWRYLPSDQEAPQLSGDIVTETENQSLDAKESLIGLWQVLRRGDMWLAGLVGLMIYWVYLTFIYVTPFLTKLYGASESLASTFSIAAAVGLGLTAGLTAGLLADKVFHSATKVLAISLFLSGAILFTLPHLPQGSENIYIGVAAMGIFAFVALTAKTIQQAPVTELGIPANLTGSAMSVNSFFGFASLLWVLKMNGHILDVNTASPAVAFRTIFNLTGGVAVIGGVLATLLLVKIKRSQPAEPVKFLQ